MSENELSRLKWQCRRGCKELDLLLEAYLEKRYPLADSREQAQFRKLLTLEDSELQAEWPLFHANVQSG